MGLCTRTMIGSCSATTDFATCFTILFGAVFCFISGELGLFLPVPAVATVDRVVAFVLITFIAAGGFEDGTGGVFVRVEARVAGADAFARLAMI